MAGGQYLVDLASGEVVVPSERDIQEALVVAQVQVHLSVRAAQAFSTWCSDKEAPQLCWQGKHLAAVVQHKHLSVLEGRHGARISIEVWVCGVRSVSAHPFVQQQQH